jgi:AcrR family transcriptional regulator
MKKRLTRQESRALTQAKLLQSAAKIIARKGFAGASIEDIAEAAGFSRGAFHANFKSKDELFLALLDKQVKVLTASIHGTLNAAHTPEETLTNLSAAYSFYSGADKDAFLLLTEAQLYSLRNPRFGKKLNALFQGIYNSLIGTISQFQQQLGVNSPDFAERMVLLGFALVHGMTLHNLMDPERFPDQMVSQSLQFAFERIFALAAPDAPTK